MERVKNIVMVALVAVVTCSASAYIAANAIAPSVASMPPYSELEARDYATAPEVTTDGVLDGSCQDDFDAYLADRVPLRNAAVLFNAGLQRVSIAIGAAGCGFDAYPTFFDSRYTVVPGDGIIIERAADNGGRNLEAWIDTLNAAVDAHPDARFAFDCVIRHDQSEANPTYRYYDNRLNPRWARENVVDRLDPRFGAFVDSVESYDEVVSEWVATEEHWKLERALKSYNMLADRLSLKKYDYANPVQVVDRWYGDYARNGLDLDFPTNLEDLPLDFSSLTYYELGDAGGEEKTMGLRDSVLSGETAIEPDGVSKYYEYFGGGNSEVVNAGDNNGKTLLFVGDSLSYCLSRYFASNYQHSVFVLPGNNRMEGSLEDYIEQYDPDDVIVMMHVTKYESIAGYSPEFIGLEADDSEG